MELESFRETFDTVTVSNKSKRNIGRFTYLEEIALQAIEGFPLTTENYGFAWTLLTKRRGNSQPVTSSHINKFL